MPEIPGKNRHHADTIQVNLPNKLAKQPRNPIWLTFFSRPGIAVERRQEFPPLGCPFPVKVPVIVFQVLVSRMKAGAGQESLPAPLGQVYGVDACLG